MNKPKAQGTSWETAFVRQAQDAGLMADRLPEGGMSDAGDVWIGDTPYPGGDDIPIVAWSRLVKSDGWGGSPPGHGQRRVADGARSVVVIGTDDFLTIAYIAIGAGFSFVAECKATERLNVTRELDKAQKKLRRWKER